ncbi:MAG: histidine phosphatase family protein [Patescibacteria group bacterium]|mgnify:CR=1 FL=1
MKPPNGESWKQMEERIFDALEGITEENDVGENILIVTHRGNLRATLPILARVGRERHEEFSVPLGSLTKFSFGKNTFDFVGLKPEIEKEKMEKGFANIVLIIAMVVVLAGVFGYLSMTREWFVTNADQPQIVPMSGVAPLTVTIESTEVDRMSTADLGDGMSSTGTNVQLDNRCTTKAIGNGLCMAIFRAVEFNQSTKKCGYVDVGGCSFLSPFNETTYQDSDKELNLCKKVCEI